MSRKNIAGEILREVVLFVVVVVVVVVVGFCHWHWYWHWHCCCFRFFLIVFVSFSKGTKMGNEISKTEEARNSGKTSNKQRGEIYNQR